MDFLKVKFGIALPAPTERKLSQIARKKGMSRSELIEDVVIKYVEDAAEHEVH